MPSGLTTPSPMLWRSVLKPLASPRRLTPGRAIVPMRPDHTVAGALAIGAQATCIAPSPDTRLSIVLRCADPHVAGPATGALRIAAGFGDIINNY